jgi:hypothetical protein
MKLPASCRVGLSGVLLCLAVPLTAAVRPARGQDAASPEFFEKRVRPVLADNCYSCHSAAARKRKGGLHADSRAALLKGGDTGPALVPGDPEKSLLIKAVGFKDVDLQMPPKGKIPDAAVADLTAWVKAGAPWPDSASPKATAGGGVVEEFDLAKRKAEHWAWQPIKPTAPPAVKDAAWPLSDVDRFLLAKLEAAGLAPAADADRRTLIRRATFALTGLPPTPDEVEAFVADVAPDAWEKVVDRLLASPAFGERWGRHWLDLVRYAESRGHEFDYVIPNAFHYRDYVIRAFNADVPYDRLVTEHIAGDLLDRPRLNPADGANESILGTGFFFLGEEIHSPVDVRQDQADRFDNRIDVLTKTFLGMTVSCARCHDHKFDAISTKDYYSLFSVLESSSYRQARFDAPGRNAAVAAKLAELRAKARAAVGKAFAEAAAPVTGKLADYLLAARDALPGGDADRGQVEDIAKERGLDAATLKKWVAHLRAAAKDKADPLHPWAKAVAAGETVRRVPKPVAAPDAPAAEVVVDYAAAAPNDFMADDVGFGPGPVRAGELHITGDAARPGVRVVDSPAAEWDRFWDALRPAKGTEREAGAPGNYAKFGRSLRTPTFAISAGPVQLLVRGSVHVYAAVSQHLMIHGPLHNALVRTFPAPKGDDGWRWVRMDLTPYRGLRAHLELSPVEGADFAVARIVQSDAPMPRPAAPGPIDDTAGDDWAKSFGRRLAAALDAAAGDKLVGSPDAAVSARLLGWALSHPELFGETTAKRLAETLAPLAAEQTKLAAEVAAESRTAPAMWDGTAVDGRVFIRGGHKALGEPAPRKFLEALAGPAPLKTAVGSGRLELAAQMTDPRVNPLLPRVMVNRVWHHLFGRGIVGSTDNFGVLGERPSHPELLDVLADRFVRDGWSVKRLVRSLMLTRAYRMSSRAAPEVAKAAASADAGNLLLWRFRVHRLEGEALRDAMLAVSGRLNPKMFGPSVPVHLNGFVEGRGRPPQGPLDGDGRRSVYVAVRRNFLSPMMLAFDTPSPFSTVGRRSVSNVPAQSLILMNDPFVHAQAGLWAKRAAALPGSDRDRIAAMYRTAFARPPTDAELAAAEGFLKSRSSDPAAWTDLAHALFNVKEFAYVN